jgi:pyruvate/2-oxoglutarate/acetoin dehydrogenase E1 component
MPYSPILETAVVPHAETIIKAVKKVLNGVRL